MNRISPISFGFQTSTAAAAITCGILVPRPGTVTGPSSTTTVSNKGFPVDDYVAIWFPRWSPETKKYTFESSSPNYYMYEAFSKKLVLHLTMSAVRYSSTPY
jgi:hypothetical protein